MPKHDQRRTIIALRRAGFKYDSGDETKLFVRFARRGNSIVGQACIISPKARIRIEASVDMTEAQVQALAMMLPKIKREVEAELVAGDSIEMIGRRRRRKRSKFRAWVHKVATRLAKAKIIQKLRAARARMLKSPLASLGIKAAAGALNAFGVPRSVTTMVLNQARATTIARMQGGGFAGQMARSTAKGAKRGAFVRESLRRQAKALPGSLMSAIPGGKMGAKLLGDALAKKRGGRGRGALQRALGPGARSTKRGVAPVADPADARSQIRHEGAKRGMAALSGLLGKVGEDTAPGYYHGATGYEGSYQRGWHGY